MRAAVDVATGTGFAIRTVTCRDDHRGWSPAEIHDEYNVVLVRRGRFRRRANGVGADLDATAAYAGTPGTEEQFSHPAGGDLCTWINVRAPLWPEWAMDPVPARSALYVDAALDLAHRRVLAAARTADLAYPVPELLLDLLGGVFPQLRPVPVAGRDATRTARRAADLAVVAAAREAVLADDPHARELLSLAALLGVSPYRLSRSFSREVGVPLSRYRNRVRVTRALDRLERGEDNLARLAADLGFADQAHMCRTVRQHLGHTPSALRRLLGPGGRVPDPTAALSAGRSGRVAAATPA